MIKHLVFTLISLVLTASSIQAQEQIKVGDVLDLEERILMKRMSDELNKPSANAPSVAPVIVMTKAPPIQYPTETLAVYGTSATFYEGQLSIGGQIFTVRNGSSVQGYLVSSVVPDGIELTKMGGARKRGAKSSRNKAQQTLFVPLATK